VSSDEGLTFTVLGQTSATAAYHTVNAVAYYSQLAITPSGDALILAAFLATPERLPQGLGGGGRVVFGGWGLVLALNVSSPAAGWQPIGGAPAMQVNATTDPPCAFNCSLGTNCCISLDSSAAAKDRITILVDPTNERWLYVAANGNYWVYRVDWKAAIGKPPCQITNHSTFACLESSAQGLWTRMYNPPGSGYTHQDTTDLMVPHVDCRRLYWDYGTGRLMLTSDGGVFARSFPAVAGVGNWTSFNGDLGNFEFIVVAYDRHGDRWIAGAQDNDVQVSAPGCVTNSHQPATGLGTTDDGTSAAVDNSVNPARLYGSGQNLDQLRVLNNVATFDATQNLAHQVDAQVPGISNLAPFFQSNIGVNSAAPQQLFFWLNTTTPGMYRLDMSPTNATPTGPAALAIPTPIGFNLQGFVVGGKTNGTDNADVFVGVAATGLVTKYANATPARFAPFPTAFADACNPSFLGWCNTWPNHGMSVSVAVAPWDAQIVAAAGWPSLTDNSGTERLFLSLDGGASYTDAFGDLATAAGVRQKVRINGMAFVPPNILVVGTVRGVYGATVPTSGNLPATTATQWARIGTLTQFPLSKVMAFTWDEPSNVLLAATMGRGIWKLPAASAALAAVFGVPAAPTPPPTPAPPTPAGPTPAGPTPGESPPPVVKSKAGIVIGVVIAAVVVVAIVGALVYIVRSRKPRDEGMIDRSTIE